MRERGGGFGTVGAEKQRVREITDEDLRQARDAWRLRRTGRPSVGSFPTFDPKQERPPLIIWYDNTPWEYDEKSIQDQLNDAKIDDDIKRRIADGQDPEDLENLPILQDRWALMGRTAQTWVPERRSRLCW